MSATARCAVILPYQLPGSPSQDRLNNPRLSSGGVGFVGNENKIDALLTAAGLLGEGNRSAERWFQCNVVSNALCNADEI